MSNAQCERIFLSYSLGDSITEGWQGVPDLWLQSFGRFEAESFGIGGDRTQELLWRIRDGEIFPNNPPQGVVLLIGTNNLKCNTPLEIAVEIQSILEEIHGRAPHANILLLGVLPREAQAYPGFPKAVKELNGLLAGYDGGEKIFFANVNRNFLHPNESLDRQLMPDGCHLSPHGYKVFADAISPHLERLMGPRFNPRHPPFLPCVTSWKTTELIVTNEHLAQMECPDLDQIGNAIKHYPTYGFINEHPRWQDRVGHMYFTSCLELPEPMQLEFLIGYDGPFRLWLNGQPFFEDPTGTNPCRPDEHTKLADLPAGLSRITIAMDTNQGRAWGFILRFRRKDISQQAQASGNYAKPRYVV